MVHCVHTGIWLQAILLVITACKKLIFTKKTAQWLQCVNARDEAGQTALHKAAMNGWLDCIHVLIDRPVDVNAIDHAGIYVSY